MVLKGGGVRRPGALLDQFNIHLGLHRVHSKSYESVHGKRSKQLIFYIMRFVRAQLCASNMSFFLLKNELFDSSGVGFDFESL